MDGNTLGAADAQMKRWMERAFQGAVNQLFPTQDESSGKEKNGRTKEHLDEKC